MWSWIILLRLSTERVESSENGTGKSTFELIERLPPMVEKWWLEAKWVLYSKCWNPKPGQRVIDVIKEYGEFIPLMKGRMISACNC
jgi:ATP-binding cassette subfamily F protein uup